MTDVSQASLKRAHDRLDDHGRRIRSLELSEAGAAQWRVATTEKLNGIESSLKWVVRLVFGAIILAAVQFAFAGGLNVTP